MDKLPSGLELTPELLGLSEIECIFQPKIAADSNSKLQLIPI